MRAYHQFNAFFSLDTPSFASLVCIQSLSCICNLLLYYYQVMMALIFPLVWTHVYIPVLPEFLLGVLGAPMPYLVGVHSSFLRTDDSQGELNVLLPPSDFLIRY